MNDQGSAVTSGISKVFRKGTGEDEVKYYKKNILDEVCDESKIKINILDNNVVSQSIDFDKTIVIRKDGYEII